MYDSMTGRIHLKLTLIPDNFQSDDAHNFACFACQYDPMTDRLLLLEWRKHPWAPSPEMRIL